MTDDQLIMVGIGAFIIFNAIPAYSIYEHHRNKKLFQSHIDDLAEQVLLERGTTLFAEAERVGRQDFPAFFMGIAIAASFLVGWFGSVISLAVWIYGYRCGVIST